ncbi:HDOD domain-containing protein [Massilia sp. R2A-15]|uniref:HDOD domain-containing protein n=1 Tax=Massilia sp. R2A-15 TaxID=3064278 RepID=UPI00273320A3|nr:HDOD domain-containing protein [Massilia sp. R2A-15]WLI91006.1 HDOD domain-containing protein [Massilia sp. R2A-15]
MINWIARWFNRSADEAPRPAPAPAAQTPQPEPAQHPAGIPALFYRWLAGPPGADILPSTERLILDEFARLVDSPEAGADLVPRVPAVIPQLLRSLRDESMSGADLSRQLAQDVVLVAEVIREANSPYYSPAAPIRNIEAAVLLLGQNGMRMLLARVAFRPIINNQSGPFALQAAPLVWRQSEACAMAGSMLAPRMGANPFEAYLAGLLHHVGLIVALRLIDQIYTGPALPQSDDFGGPLVANARVLSARIAALWEFPASVCNAIVDAGQPDAAPLAQVLALADHVGMLRLLVDAGVIGADDPAVLALAADARAVFDKLSTEEH